MAKPGPKTKPTKLKVLHGNPGRRPLPEDEIEPVQEVKIPMAPRYLDKAGKKEWRRISKELHPMGLMANVDLTALSAYCSEYSKWIYATTQIQKHGMLIKAQSGFPMQSPYLQIANKAQAEMRKWLTEFGMTPSSRAGLKVEGPKPQSKAKAFRDRKRGGKT
jgi:P27 family predicted phage terminase small subunit